MYKSTRKLFKKASDVTIKLSFTLETYRQWCVCTHNKNHYSLFQVSEQQLYSLIVTFGQGIYSFFEGFQLGRAVRDLCKMRKTNHLQDDLGKA